MNAPTGVQMSAVQDGLTTVLTHGPSGFVLKTVPPKDNGGDGSSFSPTDLIGAALAACALTTMALVAKKEGLEFLGASATVVKQMVGPPRRIGALPLELTLPAATKPEHRARLEEAARTCPVALSLHPELQKPMTFRYL
jgi:putative redox protein